MFKGGSRTATVSKMELFMTIFNAFQLYIIVAKSFILDALAVNPTSTSEILFGCNLSYLLRFFYFVLADLVEKEWEKLRNRYLRVKRELREKIVSGTGTIFFKNAKRKMEKLNFLSWMEPFIKPRQSRGTYTSIKKREKEDPVFENTLESGEIEVSGSDSESASVAKSTSKNYS